LLDENDPTGPKRPMVGGDIYKAAAARPRAAMRAPNWVGREAAPVNWVGDAEETVALGADEGVVTTPVE